jgi:signal peptidase II
METSAETRESRAHPAAAQGKRVSLQEEAVTESPARARTWKDHLPPLLVFLGVILFDHLTKWWAIVTLRQLDEFTGTLRSIVIIPGFLDFTYDENTGAAFSLFQNHPTALTAVSFVIAGMIFWWYWTTPRAHRGTRIALALVLGGAVGNLIDRVVRGAVVDFIHAFYGRYHWPTFNVADSAICIGIALLILWSFREQKAA